ncbi:MAG: hypothetical protein RLZZ230_64 [Candidatus Parcubacteria bacterium]|jgi:uncharacterized protein YecA (UPF0149 family)
MITSALTAFVISVFTLLLMLVMVEKERRRGRRFFAVALRAWLDEVVEGIERSIVTNWGHFVKYILQLHWYYSIHSVLRTLLRMIVAVYTYFESVFERNRTRTKRLRAEKRQLSEYNHLRKMAVHKKDTALTPGEQKKLRHQKLEDLR